MDMIINTSLLLMDSLNVQFVNIFMINERYHMDCYIGQVWYKTVIINLYVESFYNCPDSIGKISP